MRPQDVLLNLNFKSTKDNFFAWGCPKYCLGHTYFYTKKLVAIYMKLSWTGYLLFVWQTYLWNSNVLELEVAYQTTLPSSAVSFHLLSTFVCARGEVLVRCKHWTKNQKTTNVWQKRMNHVRYLLTFYCLTDRVSTDHTRAGKGMFLGAAKTLNPRPSCTRSCSASAGRVTVLCWSIMCD